ncbi:MAG: hypothetical protein ACTHJS_12500 [Xanthobacteraceae bacterium]|jgi:hypothetical protein
MKHFSLVPQTRSSHRFAEHSDANFQLLANFASWTLAIAVAGILVIGAARADQPAPDTEGGRYVFSKQADGFLRLDTQSGAVALCSEQPVGWACQAAPDDRAMFEREIARLQNENVALKRALLAHGLSLPPNTAPDAAATPNDSTLHLPSDAEIDRAIAFVGQVWQRFIDAIARAQKQVFTNKS